MDGDTRIAILKSRLRQRKRRGGPGCFIRNPVVLARSLRASEGIQSWQVRRGLLCRDYLGALPFEMDDLEMLAGRPCDHYAYPVGWNVGEAERYLEQYAHPWAMSGHCELNLESVLSKGLDGLRDDIRARRDRDAGRDSTVNEACQSFLFALDGLIAMIENAAVAAETALGSAPDERRKILSSVVDSCRRIAHQPPSTFRDAIQLMWFIIYGVMRGDDVSLVVPGHLDRTLWPFYQQDRQNGILGSEEALALIEDVYLFLNEFLNTGLAIAVMVGGRDAEGKDVTNELSYLCLEALRRTRMSYPTVGICWHEGTPPALVDLAIELIVDGIPTPAFFGDEVIQKGLKELRVPPVEACHYINSTCVEITPSRSSNVWVPGQFISACGLLIDEIEEQVDADMMCGTFDEFLEGYYRRLGKDIARAATEDNHRRRMIRQHGRKPLQSVFTRDCIDRGRDIDDGGALYNWVQCSLVGMANLADSLYVIREETFNSHNLTFAQLKDILDKDFQDHEVDRLRFLNRYPKYGNDNPEIDALFGQIVNVFKTQCAKQRMEPDGSPYVPGGFCHINHEVLGRKCGATPDGRRAGFPFADGCGPAQGREKQGPTAAILSTTSWDHSPMIGGLAFNMKFNRSLFDSPDGVNSLRELILTFLQRGGFETQINVIDTDTLKKARANPEDYRDLVVRIGGYTDYFTKVSPQMQEEIIARTEYTNV